jgi:hypothetical protein
MFGDGSFFGGSIFQTPPAPVVQPPPEPAQAPPPAPANNGHYTYGPNHSGYQNSGGSLTGYEAQPNQPIRYYDCGRPCGS